MTKPNQRLANIARRERDKERFFEWQQRKSIKNRRGGV